MKNIDYSLYLVTDRTLSQGRDIETLVREAVAGGVTIVQLREKHLPTPEFIALARRLKAILAPARIPLIINDNLEVALASNADGIHIGQSDMPYAEVRRQLGPDKIIGLSIETLQQLDEANHLDVDYVAASPVFSTPTKTNIATPWELEGLKTFVQRSQHPVVAIGGINAHTLPSVLACGIHGAAVVSAIVSAPNPHLAAQQLKHQILLSRIQQHNPLVHNITNYVAMNPAANALLAVGASPIMSFFPDEMDEIVTSCAALTINIGCLDQQLMQAAKTAAHTAHQLQKPWVLDPVGVGVSNVRTTFAQQLLSSQPTVIRGNASEIATLAGAPSSSHGVDATLSLAETKNYADKLAKNTHSIVVVSGPVDYVTNGEHHQEITYGSPMMARVTALGCTATALIGAFLAVSSNPFEAAVHATMHLSLAGQQTAEQLQSYQLGTFATKLIDNLSPLTPQLSPLNSLPSHPARVLTIAGSDSGGGAGIQADIKTISATGSYAASAITAITAQNTLGVETVEPVSIPLIKAQISAVLNDIGADAIKIGMLHNSNVIEAICQELDKNPIKNIVLDPVMVSTSGHRLIEEEAVKTLQEKLIPRARIITPNIPEAEILAGCTITSAQQFPAVARQLSYGGTVSVFLKAGHFTDETLCDIFYNAEDDTLLQLPHERINTSNTHGTGCTLSSALASYLAQGYTLHQAAIAAQEYLINALRTGAQQSIGHGHGPVQHFWKIMN